MSASASAKWCGVASAVNGAIREIGTADDLADLQKRLKKAGLDLPYSCKAGVCCTCRAKVMSGQVTMEKNFTLEEGEMKQGFVLSCQAVPTTPEVVVSFDER